MTPDTPQAAPADPATATTTVRVELNGHGAWEITLPDQREPIRCQTRLGEPRIGALRIGVPASWSCATRTTECFTTS
jgi:hypothetical protein